MKRPAPPHEMTAEKELMHLTPEPEVWDWVQREILADTGSIHNPDHGHLIDANIGVLWASRKLTSMRVWSSNGGLSLLASLLIVQTVAMALSRLF